MDIKTNIAELKKSLSEFSSNYQNQSSLIKPLMSNLNDLSLVFFSLETTYENLLYRQHHDQQTIKTKIKASLDQALQQNENEKHQINLEIIESNKKLAIMNDNRLKLFNVIKKLDEQISTQSQVYEQHLTHEQELHLHELSRLENSRNDIQRQITKKLFDQDIDLKYRLLSLSDQLNQQMVQNIALMTQVEEAHKIETQKLKVQKETTTKDHDQKYLRLKENYFEATNKYNAEVKKETDQFNRQLKIIETDFTKALTPIEDEILRLERYFEELSTQITNEHINLIQENQSNFSTYEKKYHDDIARKMAEFQAISNSEYSKLATFNDEQTRQRNLVNKQIKEKTHGLEYRQQAEHKKTYHNLINTQNRLKKQKEKEIEKKLSHQRILYYQQMLKLERDFIFAKAQWKYHYLMISKKRDFALSNIVARKTEKLHEQKRSIQLLTQKKEAQIEYANLNLSLSLHAKAKIIENTAIIHDKDITTLNAQSTHSLSLFEDTLEKLNLNNTLVSAKIDAQNQTFQANFDQQANVLKINTIINAQKENLVLDYLCQKIDLQAQELSLTKALRNEAHTKQKALTTLKLENDQEYNRSTTYYANQHITNINNIEANAYKILNHDRDHIIQSETELINSSIVYTKNNFFLEQNQQRILILFDQIHALTQHLIINYINAYLKLEPRKIAGAFKQLCLNNLSVVKSLIKDAVNHFLTHIDHYIEDCVMRHSRFNLSIITAELIIEKGQRLQALTEDKNTLHGLITELEEKIRVNHQQIDMTEQEVKFLDKTDKRSFLRAESNLSHKITILTSEIKSFDNIIANHQKSLIKTDNEINLTNKSYDQRLLNLTHSHTKNFKTFNKEKKKFSGISFNILQMTNNFIKQVENLLVNVGPESNSSAKQITSFNNNFNALYQAFVNNCNTSLAKALKVVVNNFNFMDQYHKNNLQILSNKHQKTLQIYQNNKLNLQRLINAEYDRHRDFVVRFNDSFNQNIINSELQTTKLFDNKITELKTAINLNETEIEKINIENLSEQKIINDNFNAVITQYDRDYSTLMKKINQDLKLAENKSFDDLAFVDRKLTTSLANKELKIKNADITFNSALQTLHRQHEDTYIQYQNKLSKVKEQLKQLDIKWQNEIKEIKNISDKTISQSNSLLKYEDRKIFDQEMKLAKKAYIIVKKDREYKAKMLK